MPKQAWSQGIASQKNAGTLFTTYTTAKSVINQEALLAIGGNTLNIGDSFTVTCSGGISNIVTTPGTITFQIMMGTIVVWSSGAIQLNATAHTTLPFHLVVDLTLQAVNTTVGGAVAKFLGIGVVTGVMFTKTAGQTDGANTETNIVVPVTAPALGTAFDSTIANNLDFWVGFSISNAGNGIQIWQYRVDGNN
jgi:hypothetical protein